MPKKTPAPRVSRRAVAKRAPSPSAKSKPAPGPKAVAKPVRSAPSLPAEVEEHFQSGVLSRGEAVPTPAPGKELPPGATHTVEQSETGSPVLKRQRFSVK